MKRHKLLLFVFVISAQFINAQTNTSPLPDGETKIGGHFHAGVGNELWTDASTLYFNYRGNAAATCFWNLGGGTGNSVLSIINTGNVGIGTTTPVYKLDVRGDIGSSGNMSIGTNAYISTCARIGQGNNGNILFNNGTGQNLILAETASNVYTFGAGAAGTIPSSVFSINTSTGNVGIGTTAPNFNLHLHGSSSYMQWTKVATGATATDGTILGLDGGAGDNNFYIRQRENSGIMIYTNDAQRMIINAGGNVGIGIIDPGSYKLNVWGRIRAHEVVVNTTGADFVFDHDYKLPNLSEVESFIKENNHLPDMAPASEMKENGINVSEMQTKLLQKVEELTIYAIEQNKMIVQQNKMNESQSKEIELLKQEIAILKDK